MREQHPFKDKSNCEEGKCDVCHLMETQHTSSYKEETKCGICDKVIDANKEGLFYCSIDQEVYH